ncbi:MAG: sulfotransferase family protein, partial [Trichodesmium sp.]
MSKILALWSTFRATSTAFECMMRERGDLVVFHEPFGLSFYNSEERRNTNRYPDAEIKAENNYEATRQRLLDMAKKQQLFIKDMPYYISHLITPKFVAEFENTFLVRDPAKMLLSLHYRWPDFTLEETGYEPLYRYF